MNQTSEKERIEFYQKHLNGVSRSFAFCIQRLEAPLRTWVGLTYLLCRVLDTIEDAEWSEPQLQQAAFDEFDTYMNGEGLAELKASGWKSEFPKGLPKAEIVLLADAHKIFNDFNQMPGKVKSIIEQMVRAMSGGMRHYARLKNSNGSLRLRNLREVNQYCFFVAGVIGEVLSDFVKTIDESFLPSQKTYIDAHHFGLFLQKVNLLKDQFDDEKEGRFLVHERDQVFSGLHEHSRKAFDYVLSLPKKQTGFRLFCLWSLFLGLASLPYIRKTTAKTKHKISRWKTSTLIQWIEKSVDNPELLNEKFDHLFLEAGLSYGGDGSEVLETSLEAAKLTESKDLTPDQWFQSIYQGRLAFGSLRELGMMA